MAAKPLVSLHADAKQLVLRHVAAKSLILAATADADAARKADCCRSCSASVADADATADVSLPVAAKLLASRHADVKSLVLLPVAAKSLHLAATADADAASQRAWACSRSCSAATKVADATADVSLPVAAKLPAGQLADTSRLAVAKLPFADATEPESEMLRIGSTSHQEFPPSTML